jgi:hypothetical protein
VSFGAGALFASANLAASCRRVSAGLVGANHT